MYYINVAVSKCSVVLSQILGNLQSNSNILANDHKLFDMHRIIFNCEFASEMHFLWNINLIHNCISGKGVELVIRNVSLLIEK